MQSKARGPVENVLERDKDGVGALHVVLQPSCRELLVFPLYRREKWSSGKMSNLSKITWGRAGIWTHRSDPGAHPDSAIYPDSECRTLACNSGNLGPYLPLSAVISGELDTPLTLVSSSLNGGDMPRWFLSSHGAVCVSLRQIFFLTCWREHVPVEHLNAPI